MAYFDNVSLRTLSLLRLYIEVESNCYTVSEME